MNNNFVTLCIEKSQQFLHMGCLSITFFTSLKLRKSALLVIYFYSLQAIWVVQPSRIEKGRERVKWNNQQCQHEGFGHLARSEWEIGRF